MVTEALCLSEVEVNVSIFKNTKLTFHKTTTTSCEDSMCLGAGSKLDAKCMQNTGSDI